MSLDVLMLGWELPPHNTGGLGVACYGLTKGLSNQGVNVNFGLPRQLPRRIPFMNVMDHPLKGVSITAINSLLQAYMDRQSYQVQSSQIGKHVYATDLYTESLRFADLASDWSATTSHDVVHAHDWMTYPAGIKASKKSGKPLIAHIHATEYDRTGGNVDPRIAHIEYQGFESADQIIAVSHYTKSIVVDKYAIKPDKITVVHNGIDFNDFQPMQIRKIFPNQKVVLYVGRLTYQKGVEYFLASAAQVLQKYPDTVFVVTGDGDMYQQHVLQAANMGIGSRVLFTGFLQGDKLRSVYQMADVFVMPSVSEPYGIVALEAIASGVPAIISYQSGVAESLEHVYKADFWDTHKIADHITTILAYPRQASEMTQLAQKEAKRLTWDKAAARTMSVYQQVLE